MLSLEPIRKTARWSRAKPRAYAVKSDGETVAIVRRLGSGRWQLQGRSMHTMFPSRLHSRGTAYRSFTTIRQLREWLASDQPTNFFKA